MPTIAYEGLFILDSNRFAKDSTGIPAQIDQIITQLGGEVLVSRLWDERRLAYPIDGHRKGTYWLIYFKLDGLKLTTLNRECQLNENIVRMMFVRIDPRLIDALVAHAQAEPTAPMAPSSAAGGDEPAAERQPAAQSVAVAEAEDEAEAEADESEVSDEDETDDEENKD